MSSDHQAFVWLARLTEAQVRDSLSGGNNSKPGIPALGHVPLESWVYQPSLLLVRLSKDDIRNYKSWRQKLNIPAMKTGNLGKYWGKEPSVPLVRLSDDDIRNYQTGNSCYKPGFAMTRTARRSLKNHAKNAMQYQPSVMVARLSEDDIGSYRTEVSCAKPAKRYQPSVMVARLSDGDIQNYRAESSYDKPVEQSFMTDRAATLTTNPSADGTVTPNLFCQLQPSVHLVRLSEEDIRNNKS